MRPSDLRVILERRLQRDRRRGFDRRIVERRLQGEAIGVERRASSDRRSVERRSQFPRRGWLDRRGSGTGMGDVDTGAPLTL